MESHSFDRLTRLAGTRRWFGLGLGVLSLLGLAEDGAARRKGRKKHCKHWRVRFSCRGTCQTFRTSSCGHKKRCKCPSGTACLANKTCGRACPPACPSGCECAVGDTPVCVTAGLPCDQTLLPCDALADCPAGSICAATGCGPNGAIELRCVRTCLS